MLESHGGYGLLNSVSWGKVPASSILESDFEISPENCGTGLEVETSTKRMATTTQIANNPVKR